LVGLSLAAALVATGCATSDPESLPNLGTGGAAVMIDDAGAGGAAGVAGAAQSAAGGSTGTAGTPGSGGSTGVAGTKGAAGAAGSFSTAGAPTFTQIYNDIIVKYCAGSACHNPGHSGGASFKTKSSAYTVFSQFAVPGDLGDSDIYAFITGDPPFMPPLDPTVPPDGAAELAAWIGAGAQNN
jgi:hypothetical protein